MKTISHTVAMLFALCLALCYVIPLRAQTPPEAISFQAVARDFDGQPLSGRQIGIRLQIRQGDSLGVAVYDERHQVTTDDLGHFAVVLGRGAASGALSSVDWSRGPYFLHVEMDAEGTGNWLDMGTEQLLSVPYALYSRASKQSDTALIALDFGGVLPTKKGGTGTSDTPYDGGVAYGDEGVIKTTPPGKVGEILTSTGANAPSWQALHRMIDSAVINVIDSLLIRDTTFMDSVYSDVSERITHDTAVIRAIMRDTIVQNEIRKTVYEVLRDSTLWRRWYSMIRDSLLSDTSFTTPLYITIRNRLSGDSTFINALFNNPLFVSRIQQLVTEIVDARAWSLRGNTGTNAQEQFLGTRDDQDLVVRTNNVERLRIVAGGSVGIGTATPRSTLDVAGGVTFNGALSPNGDPGAATMLLQSNGAAEPPVWTSDITVRKLTIRDSATFNGPAIFNDTVIFKKGWQQPLKRAHIFVGNANDVAQEYGPGAENALLQIVNGTPTWIVPNSAVESWVVGGNTAPSSTIMGNLAGDLTLAAGGQGRITLSAQDGAVRIASLAGAPNAAVSVQDHGLVLADANGSLIKGTIESLLGQLGGTVSVPPEQTTVDITNSRARENSTIIVTYEDLADTEFIFCQVIYKSNGMFRVRLSGMSRSGTIAKIHYLILNP